MRDVIVTTPKASSESSRLEAEARIAEGGGYYFRDFGKRFPNDLAIGSKIYYVDQGMLVGYAVVHKIDTCDIICEITGRKAQNKVAIMKADSWTWIEPIKMAGFQGFRYLPETLSIKVVGGWLDPKPSN